MSSSPLEVKSPRQAYDFVFNTLVKHHEFYSEAIPLIASENITSPAVREALISDFGHRYAEGWIGERFYAGCKFIDEVEALAVSLTCRLFRARYADVRPISGVVANLAVFTALTKPGDTIYALSPSKGGHVSVAPAFSKGGEWVGGTAGAVHGLKVKNFVFDEKEMNIDVDASIRKIEKEMEKPKLLVFGGSVFLFPHPVKEFVDLARDINAYIAYDAAHVAGLIAAGLFQDPLAEGADVVSFSTHKTLFGPQHGAIVTSKEGVWELVKRTTFPSVVSNHHLHAVAGLAVALAEFMEFGREYATQVIKNAKALGEALYNEGFNVVAADKGFTESHMVLVDASEHGGGLKVERLLEKAGILVNRNLLPWDPRKGRDYRNPSGVRLGTPEVTRLGMKEGEMEEIARLIRRVVIDREEPAKVAREVAKFRRNYQKIHYCFEPGRKAYEYVRIR